MKHDIIYTNSDLESTGKAFGIDAKHFIPILYALLISLALFFLISITPGTEDISTLGKIIFGFFPLMLSIVYVVLFVTGRPPHYQEDLFNQLLMGADFNINKMRKVKNPLPK